MQLWSIVAQTATLTCSPAALWGHSGNAWFSLDLLFYLFFAEGQRPFWRCGPRRRPWLWVIYEDEEERLCRGRPHRKQRRRNRSRTSRKPDRQSSGQPSTPESRAVASPLQGNEILSVSMGTWAYREEARTLPSSITWYRWPVTLLHTLFHFRTAQI